MEQENFLLSLAILICAFSHLVSNKYYNKNNYKPDFLNSGKASIAVLVGTLLIIFKCNIVLLILGIFFSIFIMNILSKIYSIKNYRESFFIGFYLDLFVILFLIFALNFFHIDTHSLLHPLTGLLAPYINYTVLITLFSVIVVCCIVTIVFHNELKYTQINSHYYSGNSRNYSIMNIFYSFIESILQSIIILTTGIGSSLIFGVNSLLRFFNIRISNKIIIIIFYISLIIYAFFISIKGIILYCIVVSLITRTVYFLLSRGQNDQY